MIGIIAGTGPSITPEIIARCNRMKRDGKAMLFGCNNSIFDFDLDVHHACNSEWHAEYAEEVRYMGVKLWTTRPEIPQRYPFVRYIEERWIPGLSTDKSYISAHHGSGPQVLNLALHYGCDRMLLVGWDMRHKGKRHYFGEYPESMRHITRNLGPDGELIGLIKEMETIVPSDYNIEIINCTAGSAMTCFPMGKLEDYV